MFILLCSQKNVASRLEVIIPLQERQRLGLMWLDIYVPPEKLANDTFACKDRKSLKFSGNKIEFTEGESSINSFNITIVKWEDVKSRSFIFFYRLKNQFF